MILEKKIKEIATGVGFDLVGISRLEPSQYQTEVEAWVKNGWHGDMLWYPKNIDRRLDPTKHLYSKALSAITVGLLYRPVEIPTELKNNPARGLIARYALYDDYHDVIETMLEQLAKNISQEVQGKWNFQAYVDTGPVLEREVGARAGLGFFGKNTTLINTTLGSYFFLAEIICDLPLASDINKINNHQGTCGLCQRCQDRCPTGAFTAPYQLDARRCISYLTIEHKTDIPEALRPLLKNWIYGCDECQEVCPWNKKAINLITTKLKWSEDLIAPPIVDLLTMRPDEFAYKFKKSPIKRITWSRFMRNVLVAAGNWGDKQLIPLLNIHSQSADQLVAVPARWARQQIL
jgi:epoxyqueuosine reductase